MNALDNLGKTPLHLALSRLRLIKARQFVSNDQLKEEITNVILTIVITADIFYFDYLLLFAANV